MSRLSDLFPPFIIKLFTGSGSSGYVPDPVVEANKMLRDDGSWDFVDYGEITNPPTIITDHGGLSGLGDDDHTQYHNNARGDARYTPIAHQTNYSNPHQVTYDQLGGSPPPGSTLWAVSGSNIYNTNSGNVGIGTTSPDELLHVSGNVAIGNTATGATRLYNSDESHIIQVGYPSNYATHDLTICGYYTTTGAIRSFNVYAQKHTFNGGNVGIGTTTPTFPLVVTSATSTGTSNDGTAGATAIMIDTLGSNATFKFAYEDGYSGQILWKKAFVDATTHAQIKATTEDGLFFSTGDGTTSAAERVRITSAGNVGIGTTSPAYKLDVVGDINITGTYRVNGTSTVLLQQTQLDAIMNRIDALETQVVALGGTI